MGDRSALFARVISPLKYSGRIDQENYGDSTWAEQTERDRVLWLIGVRLDVWRALARRGPEEEQQDAPVALDVLEELEQAVRGGIHR